MRWSGAGWCYHNQSRIALIKVTVIAKPEGDISQIEKEGGEFSLKVPEY